MDTPNRIEFRNYTLHPGRRDALVTLFERAFIESQADVGMQVLATFTDADDPDHFVWLRGFAGMAGRLRGLQAFYGGPVWQTHRNAANATMIDSDDVLLLRPLTPWPVRAEAGEWHALVCPLAAPADAALCDALQRLGGLWMVSASEPNDFPRLPVRDGAWVLGLAATPLQVPPLLQAQLAAPPRRLRLLPTPRSLWR